MPRNTYTAAQWTASNYILALNEIGTEVDTGLRKKGDGSTAWNSLLYVGSNSATATLAAAATKLAAEPPLTSGQYYCCNSLQANAVTATLGNGSARVSRWDIYASLSITRLFTDFTIVGADAGAVFRFGIWNDDGTGKPGTLLLDGGTVSMGSGATPGSVEVTVTQALTAGRYWVGGALQGVSGTQPTVRIVNSNTVLANLPLGSSLPAAGVAVCGYVMSGQTGAFGTFSQTSQSVSIPRIGFKVA